MSSYFRRLAERALGQPGIVPRRLTRFEQAQAGAPVAEAAQAAAPEGHAAVHPATAAAARAEPWQPVDDPGITGRGDAGAADEAPGGSTHALPLDALQRESAQPAPGIPPPGARLPTSDDALALPPAVRWAPAALAAAPSPLHAAAPRATRRHVEATLQGTNQPAPDEGSSPAGVPALVVVQSLPALAPLGQGQRRPAGGPSPLQPADPAVEPVRVTIGRVEVRAVFAAAPAPARPAARAAPTGPTLRDYLRSQGRS